MESKTRIKNLSLSIGGETSRPPQTDQFVNVGTQHETAPTSARAGPAPGTPRCRCVNSRLSCQPPFFCHSLCVRCFISTPFVVSKTQLAVSVYHPILFGALYKLVRAKCFNCHNLRLSKSKTRVAAVKVMRTPLCFGWCARTAFLNFRVVKRELAFSSFTIFLFLK